MAEIIISDRADNEYETSLRVEAVDENGSFLSGGGFRFMDTSFGNSSVRAMAACGIGTPVHNRRGGYVRQIFDFMFAKAAEFGAVVSVLHPFSFGYYNMFGYEKVSDHLILRFPTRMIDFVPRRCTLTQLTDETQIDDLISIYKEFSISRNLLIARRNGNLFRGRNTYICYEDGKPAAYITYKTENHFIVNHMGNSLLTVEELAYTSPSSLRELFSFLRMFEGEMDEIEISNCAMCPEVEFMLRHYTHTSYRLVPDIMARVLDTEAMLRANDYPETPGSFTVKVNDRLERVNGVFRVDYGAGDCDVKRLSDSADANLELSVRAFTRLIYGYDGADMRSASYMDGVKLNQGCTDFFRAFPKKPCGVFEHF